MVRKELYKPYFNYFYLDDSGANPVGNVNMKLLQHDIQRGVKRLPEYAYTRNWGSTRGSMQFMNALRRLINVENAKRAVLTYSHEHHFVLTIYTTDGYTLVFKGVSGGYTGEGTRGCYDILKVCGFREEQCQKVWKSETFTVFKR